MEEHQPHHHPMGAAGKVAMRPKVAIIDHNTLSMIGLKQMLQNIIPIMDVEIFNTFEDLLQHSPDIFVHYFISVNIAIENRAFFLERRNKTIVLTTSSNPSTQVGNFRYLCINVPEDKLVKSLLMLEQIGHANGRNLPDFPKAIKAKILSDREIEVLALVAQGKINKEIAMQLNISLTTVITHRKNIQEKLGMKSVSALTIYAVMHGYVDLNQV